MGSTSWASFGSGSKGNCALLSHAGFNLLIDAGVGIRRVQKGLATHGLSLDDLDALLLTHLHGDHTKGLSYILDRTEDLPVYTRPVTAGDCGLNGGFREIEADRFTDLGPFELLPLEVEHDAPETLAFRLEARDFRFVHLTDLGVHPEFDLAALAGADLMVLESNHDPQMLEQGPYPPFLKRRIAGSGGHLSNLQARDLLERLDELPRRLVLAHLSETNNTPDTARDAFRDLPLELFVATQRETLSLDLDEAAAGPDGQPRLF